MKTYVNFYFQQGYDCCSQSVISFHYISPSQMYVFDYLMYHVKLSTQLPRKLDFEEIKRHLNVTSSLSNSTIKSDSKEIISNSDEISTESG